MPCPEIEFFIFGEAVHPLDKIVQFVHVDRDLFLTDKLNCYISPDKTYVKIPENYPGISIDDFYGLLCAGKAVDLFTIEKNTESLSNKTIWEYQRLIRSVLTVAEKQMLVPYNAAFKATPPKLTKKDVTAISLKSQKRRQLSV